jgi:hypothetical protein
MLLECYGRKNVSFVDMTPCIVVQINVLGVWICKKQRNARSEIGATGVPDVELVSEACRQEGICVRACVRNLARCTQPVLLGQD